MKANIRIVFLIGILSFVTENAIAGIKSYWLYFPELKLFKTNSAEQVDERIVGFSISVYCGHIEAITHILVDWNIKINRATSTVDRPGVLVEELLASAGHGASMIPSNRENKDIEELNGTIQINVSDEEIGCFDVSADFATEGSGKGDVIQHLRNIVLPRSKLELRP